jgi:hypothetical protein
MKSDLPTTLLIGNGLNQCLDGGLPWGNLLSQIADQFGVATCSDIPMPLEFERLINVHLKNNPSDAKDIYNRIKTAVAGRVLNVSLPSTAIQTELAKLKLSNIITTNYDLLLEKSYNSAFVPNIHQGVANKPTKYLSGAVGTISGVNFYHAHGCATVPSTICLGYEHYMGMVEKIRDAINTAPRDLGKKKIQAVLDGSASPTDTWMEKFYTTNVGIIGFGLYECESDFWWLLTHRASLYHADETGNHSHIKNSITYYDIIDDLPKKTEEEKTKALVKEKETTQKHLLFSGMHVNVKKYKLSETETGQYQEAYQNIFDDIREHGV